jgi:serine/threonine protein kinase
LWTTGRAQITDIGLSMAAHNLDAIQSSSVDHGHDVRWIAPEIFSGGGGAYSKESDVFSFAMVMIEVRLR